MTLEKTQTIVCSIVWHQRETRASSLVTGCSWFRCSCPGEPHEGYKEEERTGRERENENTAPDNAEKPGP